ncbi:aspartate kinase [Porphyromonas macacae]|uniref:aspartate kinase n=1 Tax=Porphyromonas macacae TaxID=28115 RepID=UPI00052CFCC9|nr:aspartate kinase [Porphyromonas macacae]KGN99658.1 aspartate kinase [Porphyromonas macacae]
MKIMKFGGTSVASAERINHVAKLITATSEPKVIVLSAMAGTTNQLVDIAAELVQRDSIVAKDLIEELKEKYLMETQKLFPKAESFHAVWKKLDQTFFFLENMCKVSNFTLFDEKRVLAQGELMSVAMMLQHLEDLGHKACWLPALDYMRTDKKAEPDETYIELHLRRLMQRSPQDVQLFVTEGYICKNAYGDIDNLQRGGSDYTASLIGAALKAEEIQIWTDIDGMHNNDPRVVEETVPVRRLHFEEAAELAYFGAKILHPTCIQPAKKNNIPVRLLNTMEPDKPGTLISNDTDKDQIKAVAAKDGLTMIKVKSSHMLVSWVFMRRLLQVFEHYQISIDMITSSEVGVSVCVEIWDELPELLADLRKLGEVSVEEHMTIICVVGDMEWENVGFETQVLEALRDIPVRMISYGASDYNLSVLVRQSDKRNALISLSNHLFASSKQ